MLTLTTRCRSIGLGTNLDNGELIRVAPDLLSTHLHVLGPPGSGKTRFLLSLFRQLSEDRDAVIVMMNPKGALCRMARDLAIARGLTSRLIMFDPSVRDAVIGYNPLRPNGLAPTTHAKAVSEAIRAAWGQASFDQTPQLARFLFLSLAAVRELSLTLVEAVRLLQPRSAVRRAALRELRDPHLREELAYFDSLRETRQEELAASTVARLEAFVHDQDIRRILTQQSRALDLGKIIAERKILLINLEQYRPLRPDDVRILGRMLVNDLLAHVFARPEGARTPVYLILDEMHVFATNDLCTVLAQGRELGLRCIMAHQHPGQLLEEDRSGQLLGSVTDCARNKVVFGGLSVEQLEPITKEFFVDQYDPMAVKDEIRHLEIEPFESRRLVVSATLGHGRSWNLGTALTEGTSRQTSTSHLIGESETTAETEGAGSGSAVTNNTASSMAVLPSGERADTVVEGAGTAESSFASHATTRGYGRQESWGTAEGEGRQEARQVSKSVGGSLNGSVSLTLTPFYENRKRRVVASREFWKMDEYLIAPLQRLRSLPQRCFAVKVPGHPALFLRSPKVQEPWLGSVARQRALALIFSQPYYSTPQQIAKEEESRSARFILARRPGGHTIKEPPKDDETGDKGTPRGRRIPKPPTDTD